LAFKTTGATKVFPDKSFVTKPKPSGGDVNHESDHEFFTIGFFDDDRRKNGHYIVLSHH